MKVTVVFGIKQLPEWVDKDELSNCGSGAEWASYLLIEDGDYRACYSDAMEPEDCTFGRDLKWIATELMRVAGAPEERRLREALDKLSDAPLSKFIEAREYVFSTQDDTTTAMGMGRDLANGIFAALRAALGENKEGGE